MSFSPLNPFPPPFRSEVGDFFSGHDQFSYMDKVLEFSYLYNFARFFLFGAAMHEHSCSLLECG